MKKEIYGAAAKGNVEFLKEALVKDVESATAAYSDTDLLGLTIHGNNIIHVAAKHGHLDFIVEALQSLQAADRRKLICGTNSDGDTPLHIAARQRTKEIAKSLIDLSFPENDKIMKAASEPLRIQNKDGNTPLHLALLNGGWSVRVAAYLLEIDHAFAAFINNRNEAPLHLAVSYVHQGTEMLTIKMINTLNSQRGALSSTNSHFVHEDEDISLSLVRSLLEKNSEVCCLCDADGMTPLLRAAVSSNLPVVDAIIHYCPESIEVCDPKGKNMLHYIKFPTFLEARNFLEKPEIPALLINQQDHDGYTPMHIAVMNHDFGTVKAMVEYNANFSLKNKEGDSVQTLLDLFATNNKLDVSAETQIQSKSNKLCDLMAKENEKEVINDDELMSNDFYKAVGNGEWDNLRRIMVNDEKKFLSRLPDGSNIIHLAIQGLKQYVHDEKYIEAKEGAIPEEEFIVDALKKYPVLFCQTNHLGKTPLHLKMFHRIGVLRHGKFRGTTQFYNNIKEELMNKKELRELPLPLWKLKDIHGNTTLHYAAKYGNLEFAKHLIGIDANLAREVNHSKQTPLHLLCQQRYIFDKFDKQMEMAKFFIEKDASTLYSRDVEGFTPLLRAAQQKESQDIAIEIVKQHPQSLRQIDPHARNFFHHLALNRNIKKKTKKELCETVPQKEMDVLITQKDDQSNTPFDLAIENDYFWNAECLIECCGDIQGEGVNAWLHQHKRSTVRKIKFDPITHKFQNFLRSRSRILMDVQYFASRSKYGVRREDIKEYMNPMGVVAALLATVTFTAAFTVPGGYKGDTGIPNLGKKAAFQVFMVADVVGMCSSMMVLFCHLWFLSEKNEMQVTLVDMTIKLLLTSFYATLVAFMTGVYVTTISQTRWLAIFTCVICSLLILLMRRPHIKILSITMRSLPLFCCLLPILVSELKRSKRMKKKLRAAEHNKDQQQSARESS